MKPLDDLDHGLIRLLTQDGRASNRSLSARTGVTEATVAVRLRRLIEDGVMSISCVFDRKLAGYHAYGHVAIEVAGRSVADVAGEMQNLKQVTGIARTLGAADLMVTVLGTDIAALSDLCHGAIGSIRGVASVSVYLEVNCLRYRWGPAVSVLGAFTPEFPDLALELDKTDRAILDLLIENGRQPNSEIGRVLGVSEGTVRLRLRRLDDAGFMRIVARTDTNVAGVSTASAFWGINATGDTIDKVTDLLLACPEVNYLATGFGPHNVLTVLSAPHRDDLIRIITGQLGTLPGVRDLEVFEVIENLYHVYNWVRLPVNEPSPVTTRHEL